MLINKTAQLTNKPYNNQDNLLSPRLMDSVHQAQEPHDIGVCTQHNRVFECYCTQCYSMICPSCLMFDSHKGHPVAKIQEGARTIRAQINSSAKQGSLKFEKTENVLLDIRHVKLSLEENQENITKMAEGAFDELILALKNRKTKFLKELQEHFSSQISAVQAAQKDWLEKQQISQMILQLQGSNDDVKLIEEARYIIQGLERLSKPLQYRQIKLIEGLKNHLELNKHSYTFKEVKQSMNNYIQKGGVINNQLKC